MQYPNIAQPQYGFAPTMPMMPSMSDMPPAMMAKGGLASAAQNVQAQGRNGDSMLVHMTPGEVGGLQALAMQQGGSLTVNPKTGLPEANFLKSILPTLIGAGLMFIPGVNAVGAGLITGGIEAARTGDIGKGILAGLGAYGGANLAGGLMSAGTAANAANAANVAGTDALTAAGTNALEAAAPALTPTQQLTTGAQNIFASGPAGSAARTAALGNLGGYSGLATQAGMAAAPALLAQPEVKPIEPEKSTYEGPYVPTPREARFPTLDQQKNLSTSEFQYFDDVNPVPGFQPFSATQSAQAAPTTSGLSAPVATPTMAEEERLRMAGLSTPMRMKDGGVPMLEDGGFVLTKKAVDGLGKGDNKRGQQVASAGLGAIPIKGAGAKRGPKAGVDDKIKTSIEGKRPALVSNGEAYVPKKQVAKHGGAKKFYALMKKAERRA
jgi:hypothetical protein